jgi:CDGSH iron-sulfur domain-containing protein 3
MADVKIQVRKNGPLVVQGDVEILGSDGQPIPPARTPVMLCRCGQSANKPFCDGTHGKAGFQSECVRQQ